MKLSSVQNRLTRDHPFNTSAFFRGGGHCTSNVTVYEDISRSDGQVNESNNQIYHFLALEKLSKNPPSDSFFHIENSEKNVPKDSHLKATF